MYAIDRPKILMVNIILLVDGWEIIVGRLHTIILQ
jgi:hypothetical protein